MGCLHLREGDFDSFCEAVSRYEGPKIQSNELEKTFHEILADFDSWRRLCRLIHTEGAKREVSDNVAEGALDEVGVFAFNMCLELDPESLPKLHAEFLPLLAKDKLHNEHLDRLQESLQLFAKSCGEDLNAGEGLQGLKALVDNLVQLDSERAWQKIASKEMITAAVHALEEKELSEKLDFIDAVATVFEGAKDVGDDYRIERIWTDIQDGELTSANFYAESIRGEEQKSEIVEFLERVKSGYQLVLPSKESGLEPFMAMTQEVSVKEYRAFLAAMSGDPAHWNKVKEEAGLPSDWSREALEMRENKIISPRDKAEGHPAHALTYAGAHTYSKWAEVEIPTLDHYREMWGRQKKYPWGEVWRDGIERTLEAWETDEVIIFDDVYADRGTRPSRGEAPTFKNLVGNAPEFVRASHSVDWLDEDAELYTFGVSPLDKGEEHDYWDKKSNRYPDADHVTQEGWVGFRCVKEIPEVLLKRSKR